MFVLKSRRVLRLGVSSTQARTCSRKSPRVHRPHHKEYCSILMFLAPAGKGGEGIQKGSNAQTSGAEPTTPNARYSFYAKSTMKQSPGKWYRKANPAGRDVCTHHIDGSLPLLPRQGRSCAAQDKSRRPLFVKIRFFQDGVLGLYGSLRSRWWRLCGGRSGAFLLDRGACCLARLSIAQ